MKNLLVCLLFITSFSFGYDLNSISKTKAVWQDAKINLNHQYTLMVAFGRINNYLCVYNSSDYKNYSNLENSGSPVGFKVIVKSADCGQPEMNLPWIFKSTQAKTEDDLIIEMFLPTSTSDTRSKLVVKEDTSAANPYGIMTMDYNLVKAETSEGMYAVTFDSKRLENNNIEFKSAIWVDNNLSTGTVDLGLRSEFYASKVVHTPNVGGRGTVTSLNHINSGAGASPFPDGTPAGGSSFVRTTNLKYDDTHILYKDTMGSGTSTAERCISRSESWNYIPAWFGYGVYNADGDRLSVSSFVNIPVNFSGTIQTSGESFSGTFNIVSGANIAIPLVCKKVSDGTHYNGNSICPSIMGVHAPITLGGEIYENFPLLDIPDGTVLTDGSGNEYYIRQLRPRKVQAEANISNCSGLTIEASMDTPDHTFINYPTLVIPKAGAVLVNNHASTPAQDTFAGGAKWSKTGDADSDGVLNYLDSYPTDLTKSSDDDYDGIEDNSDSQILQFQQTWNKFLEKSLFSGYQK